MTKKQKLPSHYRETSAQHRERVSAEGNRFRARVETPKTVYNRKRAKQNTLKDISKGAW